MDLLVSGGGYIYTYIYIILTVEYVVLDLAVVDLLVSGTAVQGYALPRVALIKTTRMNLNDNVLLSVFYCPCSPGLWGEWSLTMTNEFFVFFSSLFLRGGRGCI